MLCTLSFKIRLVSTFFLVKINKLVLLFSKDIQLIKTDSKDIYKDIHQMLQKIYFKINAVLLDYFSKNPEKNVSQFPQKY